MSDTELPGPKITRKRNLSLIWFVPLIAIFLGVWLVYQNWASSGPLVRISFLNASGLEAGVTKIKYRDVSIGQVESVKIGEDFERVIVLARLDIKAAPYLNESTKFWVERPRVGTEGISGLGTLFSGAHIGFEATKGETITREFDGLEAPPVINTGDNGIRITLNAESAGYLGQGDPVYFKRFKVGTIESIKLDRDSQQVTINIFIKSPYDTLVHTDSRFWNASGISAEINADGISVNLQSVESLLIGGIEFDSPSINQQHVAAENDRSFQLYESLRDLDVDQSYSAKLNYIINFDQSIRGLNVNAPVEYRGLKIGRVVNIGSRYNRQDGVILLPVLVEIEPERLGVEISEENSLDKAHQDITNLGFYAKLETANLLTGQLYVSLNTKDEVETESLADFEGFKQLPTVSTDLTRIAANIGEALEKINNLEIESLIASLNATVKTLDETLKSTGDFLGNTSKSVDETVNSLKSTLTESNTLLDAGKVMLERGQSVLEGLDEGSATRYQLDQTLIDLQEAAQSLRKLTETIEKNPNSIIFGKQKRNSQ